MFNVGGPEIMVVLLVALVVLGPEQLPKAMRTFGNVMAQVRKVSNGFQDEMRSAMNTIEASTSMPKASSPASGTDNSVSEVVARNDTTEPAGSAPTASGETPEGMPVTPGPVPAPAVDPVSNRPGISAADRAAG